MVESTAVQQLDAIFHCLADGTRRRILRGLARRPQTVGELARPHAISLAAVSKHIRILEAARLVSRERRGSCQVIRLEPKRLRAADAWLAYYSKFWSERFDSLQIQLEGEGDVCGNE